MTKLILLIIFRIAFAMTSITNTPMTTMATLNTTGKVRLPKICHCSQRQTDYNTYVITFVCSSEFNNKTMVELNEYRSQVLNSIKLSKKNRKVSLLVIKSTSKWPIINESLGFFKMYDYSSKIISIFFDGFKGFDIESNIRQKIIQLFFLNSLSLYKRNREVKNCEEFVDSKSTGFIFHTKNITDMIQHFEIKHLPSKQPVCSLFFRNARIKHMKFFFIMNSFHLKRLVTFIDPSFGNQTIFNEDLNSNILNLTVYRTYNLDVTSKFLHPRIFAKLKSIQLYCLLNSVEAEVFKPFKSLRRLYFEINQVMKVIRKQGIEWIKAINSEINVDLSNQLDIDRHMRFYTQIDYTFDRYFLTQKNKNFFNNEDFCLFLDFPFRQMIFFHTDSFEEFNKILEKSVFTCTELWLFQFYRRFNFSNKYISKKLDSSNFTVCNFQQRKNLCQKSQFQLTSKINPDKQKATSFDLLYIFDFIFIILSPVLSAISILINLKTIRIILHKDNLKTMREKHYLYLCAYCLSNTIISFTQILNLMSECQLPFGFFCSSIRERVLVQFIKIIFGEGLNNTFRLFSNFAYLGFSIGRLARIGKDHGRLIMFINNLCMIKYIFVSICASALISVCKALQYQINYFHPSANVFPLPIFEFVPIWRDLTSFLIIFVFNFIFNILNYFVFVFVHLIVDVVLVQKLVKVLKEKEDKMREMKRSVKEMDEAAKENEESKRRTVLMIVLNSTLNFCTRIPLMLTSVNDLRLLIQLPYHQFENQSPELFEKINRVDEFNPVFTLKFYCSNVKSCLVFQSFGNCLFLFSLSTILSFLKRFDKNFKRAYKVCDFRNKFKKNDKIVN